MEVQSPGQPLFWAPLHLEKSPMQSSQCAQRCMLLSDPGFESSVPRAAALCCHCKHATYTETDSLVQSSCIKQGPVSLGVSLLIHSIHFECGHTSIELGRGQNVKLSVSLRPWTTQSR